MLNASLENIRIVALIEGVSFLILLFVAMPLKYWAEQPLPVKLVGWGHGVLFVLLCWLLFRALTTGVIQFKWAVIVFISSLVPFGPFMINHKLKPTQEPGK